MKANELFFKTMPFVWAKLLLGLITVLLSLVVLGILLGIAWLFGSGGVGIVMFIIWLGITGVIRFVIMHYLGYLVKAGHIAVMAEAITTGQVPANQVAYGKQMVKERFATSNIYFVIDKLVAGAVKQIQRVVGKIGSAMSVIPGMGAATNLMQFFVSISLGYIDECCLGYTFYKKEQKAFKSAADGVVIYAQNIKTLLASAAKTMIAVVLGMVGMTLVLFIIFGVIVRVLSLPSYMGFVAFIIALFIAILVKFAFMDSYILTRNMVAYMGVAPTTVITFDLYGNLCKISGKFKELFNKGQQEEGGPIIETTEQSGGQSGSLVGNLIKQGQQKLSTPSDSGGAQQTICTQCGQKINAGSKFCAACGTTVKPPEAKAAFCAQCGQKTNPGSKFCGSCGATL